MSTDDDDYCELQLENIVVKFPFQPYRVQEDYMACVLQCLKTGKNAVLESPTGTGKTLALLCSSLAWLENKVGNFAAFQQRLFESEIGSKQQNEPMQHTQILYSSRTHSQLSQAAKELKRTKYKYIKSVVIGSRDQLCLDTEVRALPSSQAKNRMCTAKINARSCQYYTDYDRKVTSRSYQDMNILDIEDLISLGHKHSCCPYYASKVLRKQSQILFMPYNYILEKTTRKMQGIALEQNVVIFDEAHNIEQCCEESRSFYVTSTDLAVAVKDLNYVLDLLKAGGGLTDSELTFDVSSVAILKIIICNLETCFDEAYSRYGSKPLEGDFVLNALTQAEVSQQVDTVLVTLSEVTNYIQSKNSNGSLWGANGNGVQKVHDMISMTCQCGSSQDLKNRFKVYFEDLQKGNRNTAARTGIFNTANESKTSWKLNFICLTAGVAMRKFMIQAGVHSIIVTSGTLSPIDSFIAELDTPFPIVLSNDHIIPPDATRVLALSSGPDGKNLLCTYSNRDNEEYIRSLGYTLCELCVRVPAGVLAFFPSYAAMEAIVSKWEGNGILKRLSSIKTVIRESSSGEPRALIQSYMQAVEESKGGALLLSVCRGRFSEGFDFSDSYARAVVIIGLPYAPKQDPRVQLKMEYLNSNPTKGLTGLKWYNTQTLRAVAQAVGRAIRHKDDFGIIVFCDRRFQDQAVKDQLPKWVKSRIEAPKDFRSGINGVRDFFQLRGTVTMIRKSSVAVDGSANGSSSKSCLAFEKTSTKISVDSSFAAATSSRDLSEVDCFSRILASATKESAGASSRSKRCFQFWIFQIKLAAFIRNVLRTYQIRLLLAFSCKICQ